MFDALAGQHVASYPGHRDIISGLAFREGSHTLYSSSFDRTVKIWSIDDGAYGERPLALVTRESRGRSGGCPTACCFSR